VFLEAEALSCPVVGTTAPPNAQPAPLRTVVLIPAYEPADTLTTLVRELISSPQIQAVVVVNDGSTSNAKATFHDIETIAGGHVLRHAVNLGKGAALKFGLNFVACTFPEAAGVVTADADGQHLAKDIVRTADALVANRDELILGARSFDTSVPLRSMAGNLLTRWIMRTATGQKLSDTQTGLRGIPMGFVPRLLRLKTTGYDFELDMLLACRHEAVQIREVPVSTIYIDGNRSSHFDPLLDSMRIYFLFIRFAAISLLTAGLDNLIFLLAMSMGSNILWCQVVSRLTAGTFNYFANRRGVFHSRTANRVAIPRYWLSVLLSGGLSYLLIHNIMAWTGSGVVPAKIASEAILFFFSFVIQRKFVFPPATKLKENAK
jgi:glycosyltransferase involved in cell wall biosynthesis